MSPEALPSGLKEWEGQEGRIRGQCLSLPSSNRGCKARSRGVNNKQNRTFKGPDGLHQVFRYLPRGENHV